MYQNVYAEIANESGSRARAREKQALDSAIAKLVAARASGASTPEAFEATDLLRRLWTLLMSDLRNEENALPAELRASLISIGLWICREADMIDRGDSANFDALIDVNQLISDGLI
ncbi:MAG: flagellar biosynthesis regulator FlhF [Methylocystis sp.]|nr:MAG: flagellar biosynthesis regulator FlhF [Methylocystis sp.]